MRFAAGALTRALSRGCSLSIQRSPQAVFLSPQRNSPVHAMLSSSVLLRCAPVATPSTSRSFVVSSPAQADKGCAAEVANAQPKGFYDMSNESLLMFCATGDFAARKERLLRPEFVYRRKAAGALTQSTPVTLKFYSPHLRLHSAREDEVFPWPL